MVDKLRIEQLRNLLASDLELPLVWGFRRPISYSAFNGAGPAFDALVFEVLREWKASGGGAEADQLLALLRPTDSLRSVIQGAIGFLELLLPSGSAGATNNDAGDDPPPAVHSPDFRSVNWFGANYSFTANQAACVKVLWEAWQSGVSDVGGETLLQAADADTQRIDVLFRDNPAWRTMIVQGGTKGSYRLTKPTADSPKRPKRTAKKTSARARK